MPLHCRVHVIVAFAALASVARAVEYTDSAVDNPVSYIVKTQN